MTAAVKVVVKVVVGSAVVGSAAAVVDLEVVDLEVVGSAAVGSAAVAVVDSAVVDSAAADLEAADSAAADSAVVDSAVADSAVGAADSADSARTSACYTTNTWYCSDAKSSNLHCYCKRGRYSSSACNNSAIPTTNNTFCCSNYICICTVDASGNFVFACKYLRHNFCCSRSSCTNC